MLLILNVGKGKVINLGKVMVLSFTDDEEDIYRGILNIVNGSNNFEQYNIFQNIKKQTYTDLVEQGNYLEQLRIAELTENIAEKGVRTKNWTTIEL